MTDTKIALITGASRGLGAAFAKALSADHHVVAVAQTVGGLEELDDAIKERGGHATLAPMDITNSDAMAHLCRSVFDRWGRVDTWVHCAIHAAPLTPAGHIDAKDWNKSMAVNSTALAQLIPMLEPLLRAAPSGRAILFDDQNKGVKFFGTYGASKAAQVALAQSWQNETANIGPAVHIVTPNPMPTATRGRCFPGEDRSLLATPEDEAKRLLATI